jgi:hypothetical protein
MKITGQFKGAIDCKRFHLPGIVIRDDCPKCKRPIERDYESHYFSYPKVGERLQVYFWCEDCDAEWWRPAQLQVSLEAL